LRTTEQNRELVIEVWQVVDAGQRLDELAR
jgi:hypothetical protein